MNRLTAVEGYCIDGAAPAISSARRSRASAIRTATASAISQWERLACHGAGPARARLFVVPWPRPTRRREIAVTPPLHTHPRPAAGAGRGASLAAAGTFGGSAAVLARAPGEAGCGGRRLPRDHRKRPPTSRWPRRRSLPRTPGHDPAARSPPGRRWTPAAPIRSRPRLTRGQAGLVRRRRQRHARPAAAARLAATAGFPSPAAGLAARVASGRAAGCDAGGTQATTSGGTTPATTSGAKPGVAKAKRKKSPPAPAEEGEALRHPLVKGKRVEDQVEAVPPATEPQVAGQEQVADRCILTCISSPLRQPPLAQAAPSLPRARLAVVAFGVFSSSVGIGALPTSSLPDLRVTNGTGSRATVAELGDVNGDGIGDYGGRPAERECRLRHRLRPAGALAPTRPDLNHGAASFTITGHGGERPGPPIAGDDVNGDHLDDIAIPLPAARTPKARPTAAPCTSRSARRTRRASPRRSSTQPKGGGTGPASPSPPKSRDDSFGVSSAQGHGARPPRPTSAATASGTSPSPNLIRASIDRESKSPCSTASPTVCTSTSATCGRTATPTTSTSTSPHSTTSTSGAKASPASATKQATVGETSRSGLRRPTSGPRRLRLGLDHQRSPASLFDAGCSMHMVDNSCPDCLQQGPYRRAGLPHRRRRCWRRSRQLAGRRRRPERRRHPLTSRSASRRRRLRDAPAPERSSWCRASAAERSQGCGP